MSRLGAELRPIVESEMCEGRELANPTYRREDSGFKWHHHRAATALLQAGLAQFWYRKRSGHGHLCSGQWTELIQCFWLMWDTKWPQWKKKAIVNTDMLILKFSVQRKRKALGNIHICDGKKISQEKEVCTKVQTQLWKKATSRQLASARTAVRRHLRLKYIEIKKCTTKPEEESIDSHPNQRLKSQMEDVTITTEHHHQGASCTITDGLTRCAICAKQYKCIFITGPKTTSCIHHMSGQGPSSSTNSKHDSNTS